MPEIKRSFSTLKINGQTIDNNFKFKISRSAGSLNKTLSVDLKKSYFLKNRTGINIGDNISIFSKNNNEEFTTLFNGMVTSCSMTSSEIFIESMFCCVDDEELFETYKDTTIKDVLSKFVPKLKYEASDSTMQQIILRGTKEHCLNCLLRNKYYYLDLDDTLVVQDKPKIGKTYGIEQLIDNPKPNVFAIFPIFGLEINDTITFQKVKYSVQGIKLESLSEYRMILETVPFETVSSKEESESPPPDKEDSKQKQEESESEDTKELSIDDLFALSEKLAEKYQDINSLFAELYDNAKNYIYDLAKKVYHEMGKNFQKIVITQANRTVDEQVAILSKKMVKDGVSLNMYEYYKSQIKEGEEIKDGIIITPRDVGRSATLNYLNAIQSYFDGGEEPIGLEDKRWVKIIGDENKDDHKNNDRFKIKLMGQFDNTKIVSDEKTSKRLEAETLMKDFMGKERFNPSKHLVLEGEKGFLLDLRIRDGREDTATKVYEYSKDYYCKEQIVNNEGGVICAGYKIGLNDNRGDPHIHLRLVTNYEKGSLDKILSKPCDPEFAEKTKAAGCY